ncbi:MAG: TlpA family protein disulfide reductase [Myxococcota bacterium]|nr:TlpA family protein disulfide reductase [Myxococcota bacterium]
MLGGRDRRRAVLLIGALAIGCGRREAAPGGAEWYRAVVGDPEVPFFVSMPAPGTPGRCTIVNGEEHLDVVCSWKDASTIELEFPMFATSIRATRDAGGALTGTWEMSRISGSGPPAPFAATRIARPDPQLRFPAPTASAPASEFGGIWKFEFRVLETGKGILKQTPDGIVTGTIIPQGIGDMRYLAGNARGTTLLLSTFDGQHAYVLRAELTANQASLIGTWDYANVLSDRFTARRVTDLDIAVVEKVRLRAGATTVTIPQLADPSFRGKPMIVDYFGTWCPACMDQTPLLLDLYRRHHAAGLEILSIALEGTTDTAYNERQVEHFRKRYAIPWRIDVVPGEYAESESLLPPELEGTGGYPITIFLDRDHQVRAVHSGFYGPAAGDEYHRLVKLYEQHVLELLRP